MSFEAAAWAIKQHTKTATQKLVLISIADCQSAESGRCFPSMKYLSEHALCSERQAMRCVQALEEIGLIIAHREIGKSNYYTFNFSATSDTHVTRDKMSPVTPTVETSDTHVTLTKNNQENNNISKSHKTSFPNPLVLTNHHMDFIAKNNLNIEEQIDAFTDYHKSKGSRFADWQAAFNTWLRNAVKFSRGKSNATNIQHAPKLSTVDRANQAAAEWRKNRESQRGSNGSDGNLMDATGRDVGRCVS